MGKCPKCNKERLVYRKDIRYWPDHLWVPKIQAHFTCRKCKYSTWTWKHELPTDWQKDCPYPDWGTYYLPRLIESCEIHHIEAIPGKYPTSEYWKKWIKENGFEKNHQPKSLNLLQRINCFIKRITSNL